MKVPKTNINGRSCGREDESENISCLSVERSACQDRWRKRRLPHSPSGELKEVRDQHLGVLPQLRALMLGVLAPGLLLYARATQPAP